MRKFLFIFILPFLHGYCGSLATAQTYLEKQSVGAYNLLTNPGFENGLAKWTVAAECSLGTRPYGSGVRSITCTGVTSAKTLFEQSVSVSNYIPYIDDIFKSSVHIVANSDVVQVCLLFNGAEQECRSVEESASLNAAGYKEIATTQRLTGLAASFTVGIRVKTTGSTTTAINADAGYVGPFKGVVGLNPNATEMVNAGTITIGAVTSAPTKGGTPSLDIVRWGRRGDLGVFRYEYKQTAAGTTGTGHYLFTLPNGLRFDSNKISFYSGGTGTVGPQAANAGVAIGGASVTSGTSVATGEIVPYDATRFRIYFWGVNGGYFGSGYAPLNVAATAFTADFIAPIEGWSVGTVTDTYGLVRGPNGFPVSIDGSGGVLDDPTKIITSCTNANPSVCTFKIGHFSVTPICVPAAIHVSGRIGSIVAVSSSSISIRRYADDGANVSSAFNFICYYGDADHKRWLDTYDNVPMGIVKSGTYTPTITIQSNIVSTSGPIADWYQIGDKVFVNGQVTVTPNASSATSALRISIPVPRVSNFAGSSDCRGSGQSINKAGVIGGVSGTQLCELAVYIPSGWASTTYYGFSFSYSIK